MEILVARTITTVKIKIGEKISMKYTDPNTGLEKVKMGWPEEYRMKMKDMFNLVVMSYIFVLAGDFYDTLGPLAVLNA